MCVFKVLLNFQLGLDLQVFTDTHSLIYNSYVRVHMFMHLCTCICVHVTYVHICIIIFVHVCICITNVSYQTTYTNIWFL